MTLERARDRDTVRKLAEQVVELALSDEYEARRKRWRDVNGLRKPDRFSVYCSKPVLILSSTHLLFWFFGCPAFRNWGNDF
jgi:hypothetical protein